MMNSFLSVYYNILELLGIGWFEYYSEWSVKLSIYFSCRRNKYTNRKYFRSMRPVMLNSKGIWDDNEWIEYDGNLDDNLL